MRAWKAFVSILGLIGAAGCVSSPQFVRPPTRIEAPFSESLSQAILRAGANRAELEKALRSAPAAQQEGVRFLVENMPDRDLRTLSAHYLLENTALAYEALERAPWKARIPKELFLNDVLPYASLTEKRDGSRAYLRGKAAPLVAGCTSPAEAAQRLNKELFNRLNVHYSLEGVRPDQSPSESIERSKATCIGLSVLLVGACRAVGVPARVAGTPAWTSGRGNGGTHEWVEIWDGDWHFLGADEHRSEGLDQAWFNEEASKALRDKPMHAIYAVSFRRTGLLFPLSWVRKEHWVDAINVTDRYVAVWALNGPRRPGSWQ
jgi:hypothetical protein